MSTHAPLVTPADLVGTRPRAGSPAVPARPWIRGVAFALLALYGVQRWSRLMRDPPSGRLLGLAGVAIALAVVVPLVRRRAQAWPASAGRVLSGALALALGLAALVISGLRWHWVVHVQIAVSARAVGDGLSALANVLVPYLGDAHSVRLVMLLGAAVLLLDAAAVLAFAGRGEPAIGDGRRAAAALPLIALAVVPATLVRPHLPALQGLVLFALLVLFVWGERIGREGVAAAVAFAGVAGVVGAIAGPRIETHRPWVDYRAWAGAASVARVDRFDWNQTYGPLRWPQSGHVVFTVHARAGDYWKAEDLSAFDGSGWVASSLAGAPALPTPSRAVLDRYSQDATITLQGMTTRDVIGGSGDTGFADVPGGQYPGAVIGTWVAARTLAPGTSYQVRTYSPTPSPAQLRGAGATAAYPWARLTPYLSLELPAAGGATVGFGFGPFGAGLPAAERVAIDHTPYAPALALAQRLAAGSPTPYDFVRAVERHLDGGAYVYDQNPAPARYPLLDFLFASKVGYCQQFSGAMAMLLRMGGVPARVATGFTSGSFDPTTHAWTVSDVDAHAWVEAWFPHYGWVKFDPTPTSAPARSGTTAPPTLARRLGPGDARSLVSRERQARTHPTATTAARTTAHRRGARRGAGGAGPWPWIAGGAALLMGLAGLAAGAVASARRRRRADGHVGGARWGRRGGAGGDPLAELERAMARTRRPLGGGVTLASLERRFRSSPQAAAYIRALRLSRYGGDVAAPSAAQRRALRAELRAGLGPAGRLRALWALPPRPPRRTPRRVSTRA